MRVHVAALFAHDRAGRMLRVNEPDGQDAPRFFLGRTAEGSEWRFRYDTDDDLQRELASACQAEPVGDEFLLPPYGSTIYETTLARVALIQRKWAGPAYRFPDDLPVTSGPVVAVTEENVSLLHPHLEEWVAGIAACQPVMALVIDRRAVALCASVRVSDAAHEAGVETAPDFRGRGFATRVVVAWARAVRMSGPIPLYSTSWSNVESQALARKLRLVRYGTDLHIR